MAAHKVIGLVSGGKDSCFNLLHCEANGHDIVALATLTPSPGIGTSRLVFLADLTDELDSHLYQSVGTSVPPLIAQAMGVPHYSKVIKGKAVARGPEYGERSTGGQKSGVAGDETEDLFLLLQEVIVRLIQCSDADESQLIPRPQRCQPVPSCPLTSVCALSTSVVA